MTKNLESECLQQMKSQVDDIVKAIETGEYDFDKEVAEDYGYDEPCAAHYLQDILDFNYIINRDKTYRGARILVAFGGPNIWINTLDKQVAAYWGGDKYIQSYFEDKLGLDDYMEEEYKNS